MGPLGPPCLRHCGEINVSVELSSTELMTRSSGVETFLITLSSYASLLSLPITAAHVSAAAARLALTVTCHLSGRQSCLPR